jgi:hypothetical protein
MHWQEFLNDTALLSLVFIWRQIIPTVLTFSRLGGLATVLHRKVKHCRRKPRLAVEFPF